MHNEADIKPVVKTTGSMSSNNMSSYNSVNNINTATTGVKTDGRKGNMNMKKQSVDADSSTDRGDDEEEEENSLNCDEWMQTIISDTDSTCTITVENDGYVDPHITHFHRSLGYHCSIAYKTRIKPIDIVRTPLYERVWEVASLGEVSFLHINCF